MKIKNNTNLFYVVDGDNVYLYVLELNYDNIDMKDGSKVIIVKKKKDSSKKS